MKDINEKAFLSLFNKACERCFGHPLTDSLSETDSKILSTKIFEQTGLTVGAKSIKNYSIYIIGEGDGKKENPSVATLDTFARYVLQAPYTDDLQRKENEDHHPYWFEYRGNFMDTVNKGQRFRKFLAASIVVFVLILLAGMFFIARTLMNHQPVNFSETFDDVSYDSLKLHGWQIKNIEPTWWNKRNERPGHLSLFTLRGDNWSNGQDSNRFRNVLMRKITAECFTTEIHVSNFFPQENWQQAGILLAEDSTFSRKVIRLSFSYNDFFGGYDQSPEIIIQGVSSSENGDHSKPEEFIHTNVFTITPGQESIVQKNLSRAVLKIEKHNQHFRFLYTAGTMESFALKELASKDFSLKPTFIAVFAMQGLSQHQSAIPVYIDSFIIDEIACIK